MIIRYFGHSHLFIKGNDYSITLDPFSNINLKEFKVESDYVFCSHNHFDHNNKSLALGAKEVKNGYPFEIIKTYHDEVCGAKRGENNIIIFNLDGKKLAFLGDLGEADSKVVLDKISGVDVLFIPVGGVYTINSSQAFDYAKKSNAKAVVPIHFKIDKCSVDVDEVENFLEKFDSFTRVKSPYDYSGESGVILIENEQGDR